MLRVTVQGPGFFELDFKRNIVKQVPAPPLSFDWVYATPGYHIIQGTGLSDLTVTPLGPSFIPQSQSIPPFPTVDPSAVAALETKRVCECGAEKARTTHAHWCPKWS